MRNRQDVHGYTSWNSLHTWDNNKGEKIRSQISSFQGRKIREIEKYQEDSSSNEEKAKFV